MQNKAVVFVLDSYDLFLRVNKSRPLNQTQLEITLHSQNPQLILKMKESKKTLKMGLLQPSLSQVWHRWSFKHIKPALELIITKLLICLLSFYNFSLYMPLIKRVILLLSIAGHYLYIFSIGSVYCRSHDSLEFRSYYLCLESNTFIISQGACSTVLVSAQWNSSSCNCCKARKVLMHVPQSLNEG